MSPWVAPVATAATQTGLRRGRRRYEAHRRRLRLTHWLPCGHERERWPVDHDVKACLEALNAYLDQWLRGG